MLLTCQASRKQAGSIGVQVKTHDWDCQRQGWPSYQGTTHTQTPSDALAACTTFYGGLPRHIKPTLPDSRQDVKELPVLEVNSLTAFYFVLLKCSRSRSVGARGPSCGPFPTVRKAKAVPFAAVTTVCISPFLRIRITRKCMKDLS